MKKIIHNYIKWDNYWIQNNPSTKILNEELTRLNLIQKKEENRNRIWTNMMSKRVWKILILKKLLWLT